VEGDTIEIKFTNPLGTGLSEGNVAVSSALGRPFKRLFESGKPIEKLTYIYFQPPQGPLRTLGSLCHSAGGRVVFYPGLTTRSVRWFSQGDKLVPVATLANELLDHITLESDFVRWHSTILTAHGAKRTRIPNQRTRQVEKDLIFWFALCVGNPATLELAPATLTLGPFPVTSSDSKRRAESAIMAREGAVFIITQLHDDETLPSTAFVTFEFWICRNPKERRHEVVVPIAPPAVAEPLSLPTELQYRGHDIVIPGLSTRFSVNAYKLVGTLAEEAIICSDTRSTGIYRYVGVEAG